MASVFVRLLKAYRRHGFFLRTGLNPLYFNDPDAAFTRLFNGLGAPVSVGAGLAPQEIHFLESLVEAGCRPKNVLVIGNAFGWSALALAVLLPEAVVVAMDAGLEGEATAVGTDLTRTLAVEEGLDVRVVEALSPRDVPQVVAAEFGGRALDFVLVDGLHLDEQLRRDFDAVAAHASAECVFVLHDVLSWHMVQGFASLPLDPSRERRILTRCPSGMGVVFPRTIEPAIRDVIDAFCDDTVDLAAFHAGLGATADGPGPVLTTRLAPGWKTRRLGLASTYEMEGRADLIPEQLARAVAEGRDDPATLCEVAAFCIDRGRWQEAERPLRYARRLAPDWEVPAQHLGRVLQQLRRDDEARACLEDASRLRPDWAVPPYELGLMSKRLAGDAAAVPSFTRAIELDPTWASPSCELGAIHFRMGDDTAAIGCLERAVSLDPRSAPAHHLLGLARRRRDGPLAGLPALERAVDLDPDCAFTRYDLARATSHLGDDSAAITHLERAVAIAPAWALAWREAGACAARLGKWKDASDRLVRAAELGHTDAALWNEIAASSVKAEEWGRALDAYRISRQAAPDSWSIDKDIAICLHALGRLDESAAVLAAAIAERPGWAGAHFELGRTYESLEQWGCAEGAFRRAVELRPAWQEAHDALARAHERTACRVAAAVGVVAA